MASICRIIAATAMISAAHHAAANGPAQPTPNPMPSFTPMPTVTPAPYSTPAAQNPGEFVQDNYAYGPTCECDGAAKSTAPELASELGSPNPGWWDGNDREINGIYTTYNDAKICVGFGTGYFSIPDDRKGWEWIEPYDPRYAGIRRFRLFASGFDSDLDVCIREVDPAEYPLDDPPPSASYIAPDFIYRWQIGRETASFLNNASYWQETYLTSWTAWEAFPVSLTVDDIYVRDGSYCEEADDGKLKASAEVILYHERMKMPTRAKRIRARIAVDGGRFTSATVYKGEFYVKSEWVRAEMTSDFGFPNGRLKNISYHREVSCDGGKPTLPPLNSWQSRSLAR